MTSQVETSVRAVTAPVAPKRLTLGFDPFATTSLAVVLVVSTMVLGLLATVGWLSLMDGLPGDAKAQLTLENYHEVFTDPFVITVLLNTLKFCFATLAVALPIGLAGAWLVERTNFRGRTLVLSLMTIGLLIPGFASAMGWLYLLHPRIGILNAWLQSLFGLSEAPLNIMTIAGMGWVQGLNLAPLIFIMTAAVFRAMDPALEEAASAHGVSNWRTIRKVTLPLAWPGILAASIYVFVIGFAAFDVPAVLGWGNRIFTFSTFLLSIVNGNEGLPRYGLGAALSAVVIVIAALLGYVYALMQQKGHRYTVVTGKAYRPRKFELGRWHVVAWLGVALYFIFSKLVPLVLLVYASLLPFFQFPSMRAFSLMSFVNYRSLSWDLAIQGILNTGILMVLTPTIVLAISLAFSWVVLRSRVPGRRMFDFVAFLPHAVPNIIFGIGALLIALYVLQSFIPLYGTIWLVLLVFVVARLSYGTRMTNSGLIQIHKELEEAAQVSGASSWKTFRVIVLPLLAPTLLYAWLWIALLTYRELTLAVVVTTSNNITLPVVVWSLWSSGGLGRASALAVVTMLLVIPLVIVYWLVANRRGAVSA
jgi:iron(III) transport system permease protein